MDEWEAAEQFPAHEVCGKLGKLGLLGRFALSICKDGDARTVRPVQFGVARP